MTTSNLAIKTAIPIIAILFASTNMAIASDQALLDILFENGVLNKIQYQKLSRQAKEKQSAKKPDVSPSLSKALDWTSKVNVSGDIRFRHENINTDNPSGVKESRQRIRARIKVAAQINDQVDVGFRLVTGGGQTSANRTIEGSFRGKNIFFDRAFIHWRPDFIKGLSALFGKFKQPWYNVNSHGLIWDSDVNPEGVALKYKTKVGQANLAATGGYFILEDGDTVQGDSAQNDGFSDDLNMYHAGISATTKLTDSIKGTLGSNAYIYNKESKLGKFKGGVAGNFEITPLEIYEVAGKIDFKTCLVPVYIYAQYAVNAAAVDAKQNTAWLAGLGTKYGPFKMDYNYRDTEALAVADTFNDGTFATGKTASRGHKIKLAYSISKNFATGVTYVAAEQFNGINIDTLQLDLKAKF